MRTVLVPLDGSDLAETVLSDARRLAGRHGTLLLVRDSPSGERGGEGEVYLESLARSLQAEGVSVKTQVVMGGDPAEAIDRTAAATADMIAVATHGRDAVERWQQGSVAWRTLQRSTVPVLIRHAEMDAGEPAPGMRSIMVPLDGSALAEKALPLAVQLATEWGAMLQLVTVVDADAGTDAEVAAADYLQTVGAEIEGEIPGVHTVIATGSVGPSLQQLVDRLDITDLVMTSHGKTAVSTALVGAVAADLIHRLHCPIVVIPPLVTLGDFSLGTGTNQGQNPIDRRPGN